MLNRLYYTTQYFRITFYVKLRASKLSEFHAIYTLTDIVFHSDNKETLSIF